MKDYVSRLLEETRELAIKLNKLNVFMTSDFFAELPREKKDLMYDQVVFMQRYVQTLGKRLELEGVVFTFS